MAAMKIKAPDGPITSRIHLCCRYNVDMRLYRPTDVAEGLSFTVDPLTYREEIFMETITRVAI